ncbi:hypothetical protein [Terracoccus sp. 273MFTsu3.1]|uniref:hypothetical protein n=1 Tax=Terracoccus sp. 273MFTsu3.1 TaxID=1172188 RepID=UPI0003682D2C|nr:hypothetical protein [Terracoccus sp. 273MFTsu3.1]
MTEQWNLQTNLKPKPNAQGTLFSGGKSQIPAEKRYPRGYTPERMRAVQSATMVEGAQISPNVGPYMATRHDVLSNLARSSAPVEDMRKLHVQVGSLTESQEMAEQGKAGDYRSGGGGWGRARVALNQIHGDTVIHELGHHVSHTQGTEHSEYALPSQRGREEGFADAYADKHFNPHPSAKKLMLDDDRRGTLPYLPSDRQASTRFAKEHFASGYNAMRPMEGRVPNGADESMARTAARARQEIHMDRNVPTLPGL